MVRARRVAFAALAASLLASAASATTYVLVTVDTESYEHGNPASQIYGRISGRDGEFGVPLMLRILEETQGRATFFLNVYEAAKHGEQPLRDIAKEIVARGQDVQLHTHPKPMYGKRWMSEYGLAEQTRILEEGRRLLQDWSGRDVIAHRAGAYAANAETLLAVRAAGLWIDASLSPASESSALGRRYTANDLVELEGVVELPLTYYAQVRVGPWQSLKYVDIESSSFAEIRSVLRQMAERRACAVNVMVHSFSFVRDGRLDEAVIARFRNLLEFVRSEQDLRLVTVREFGNLYRGKRLECEPAPGFVPATGVWTTYLRSWEHLADGWKYIVVAASVPVLVLAGLAILVMWVARRKDTAAMATRQS